MEKLFGTFVIFAISLVLFLIGYNFTFNTVKIISKFNSLAGYKEGSKFYKILPKESHLFWAKVNGIGLMTFALMLFVGMIVLLIKRYYK